MSESNYDPSGDLETLFGLTDAESEAIMDRAKAGQLTDQDQAKVAAAVDVLSELWPQLIGEAVGIFGLFGALFDDPFGLMAAFNEFLAESGFTARLAIKPTYRTEPIPGAELGGQPRNPEADVIDEIDQLVDWQLGESRG